MKTLKHKKPQEQVYITLRQAQELVESGATEKLKAWADAASNAPFDGTRRRGWAVQLYNLISQIEELAKGNVYIRTGGELLPFDGFRRADEVNGFRLFYERDGSSHLGFPDDRDLLIGNMKQTISHFCQHFIRDERNKQAVQIGNDALQILGTSHTSTLLEGGEHSKQAAPYKS